jgi:hypothetical protein
MNNQLYKKHNYLDKNKRCIISLPIRAYDMVAGGYSVLKREKVFSQEEMEYLDNTSKFKRNYYIGNKVRKENLSEVLMNGFIKARKLFIEANKITDDEILSIKKDAIFLVNKPARYLSFRDEGLEFRLEESYSSYYYINDMEIYFSNNNSLINIKGINDDMLEKHREFFLDDLVKIFKLVEGRDIGRRNMFIKSYRDLYLKKELDIGCYRQLDQLSMFLYKDQIANSRILIDDIDDISKIDITYNYLNYLVPLYNMIF